MINIPIPIIIEFFLGIFIWWIAVYLISQNPYHKMVRLIFGLFASIGVYFSTDLFFYSAISTGHYYLIGHILRLMAWAIYLPSAFFYHIGFGNKVSKKQKIYIYLSYSIAAICIGLESLTNTTRNYGYIASSSFKGDLATATGPLFWLSGTFIIIISVLSIINLFGLIKKLEKGSLERKRLFIAFYGVLVSILISPFIIMGYYNIIPHASILSSLSFLIMAAPLFYSIVRYNLFIDDTKIVFGKNFLYSTASILFILTSFSVIYYLSGNKLQTTESLVLPFLFIYFLIVSHPLYNWVSTFAQDLIYNLKSGLSVVNDQEVYEALKNFHLPEKLEDNSLLRLSIINRKLKNDSKLTPIDSLKDLIRESIEYFEPKSEPERRIKANLKYYLLKMIVLDEAEEGQILWELGFDEYPVKIMSQERKFRSPMFQANSPADYTYTSRNAFLALKKEAIHDITWRISYLEKIANK